MTKCLHFSYIRSLQSFLHDLIALWKEVIILQFKDKYIFLSKQWNYVQMKQRTYVDII